MQRHIVSFSGGKDSTAMLLLMLEKGWPIDRIIFVDTTKEFPQMYKHIDQVQRLCPIPIERVAIDYDYWFSEHIKKKGKHKGEKGYGWATSRTRWCTALKREAFAAAAGVKYQARNRIVTPIPEDIIEYHGIASDETKRIRNIPRVRYPLVEWGLTETDALQYCRSRGLTWGGLYDAGFTRVSCFCCPLKRIEELRILYRKYPELWLKLYEMDQKSPFPFKANWTVPALARRFFEECFR
jgi:3'-phosphoadenosine 5'-phosphosulfate sulfotransferase (PAPS reductase)/FAD synthetase